MNFGSVSKLFGVVFITLTQTLLNCFNVGNCLFVDLCSNGWNSLDEGWIFDNNLQNCPLSTSETAVIWYGESNGETYNNEFDNCKKFIIEIEMSLNNGYNGGILFKSSKMSKHSRYGHGSTYLFVISAYQNVAALVYGISNSWKEIYRQSISINYNKYYKLKIDSDGTFYTFYINDNILWENVELTRYKIGSFGLRSNSADINVPYFNYQCFDTPTMSPSPQPTTPTLSPTQMIPNTCGPSTCLNYGNEYSFSLNGPISTLYHYQYKVGKVNIGKQFEISFDLLINSLATTGRYRSILSVGNNDIPRIPGFWLYPNSNRLAMVMSDSEHISRFYPSNFELEINVLYKIVIQICDGTVSAYINNELMRTVSDLTTITGYDQSIFISRLLNNAGNTAYDRAQVTISNLEIKPCLTI